MQRWVADVIMTASNNRSSRIKDVPMQSLQTPAIAASPQSPGFQASGATAQHRLTQAKLVHDLRAPIYGVLGILHLLTDCRNDEQKWTEALDIVRSCARHQLLLVDDIVDLARLGAYAIRLHPKPFGLRASLQQTLAMVSATAQLKGLELALTVSVDVPDQMVGDERRLRQVLLNLVANAIKHTHGGAVRLEVKLADESNANLEFLVTDTGRGMNAESLAHLGELFGQFGEERTDPCDGAGLGLVLCKEMLALMGSQLHCTSAPDQGSTFSFLLRQSIPDEGRQA